MVNFNDVVKDLRLKHLQIENFRSIHDTQFDIKRLNILVGSNDNGKSNILRAIRAFLDQKYKFAQEDFPKFIRFGGTGKVTDTPIEMNAQFDLTNDAGSKHVRAIHNRFRSLLNVKKTTTTYTIDYNYSNNASNDNKDTQTLDVEKAYMPIVKYIDLSASYATLEDGNWSDCANEIINSVNRLSSKEDKQKMKTSINNILHGYWSSDNSSAITISIQDEVTELDCLDKYGVTTFLNQRGTGFQAFIFTALQIMNVVNDANLANSDIVILIEEPERMLHPQAQRDFIRLLKQFVSGNPTITFFITTHSPSIVMADRLANVLLVRKSSDGKSYIEPKPHANNWKTLRDDLGMFPSDSMLIGDITIIVEGACEQVYIPELLAKFCDFNIDIYNFVNAQGVANIVYYTKILKNLRTHVIALFDNDSQGIKKRRDLLKDFVLTEAELFTYESNDNKEIAFEDLFDDHDLFDAIQTTYEDKCEEMGLHLDITAFEEYCAKNKIPKFSSKCWAYRMSTYLEENKIIKSKDSLDKLSISKFCVDRLEACPPLIKELSEKIKIYTNNVVTGQSGKV